MKKLTAIVLLFICIFGLVTCSSNPLIDLNKTNEIEIIQFDKLSGTEIRTVVLTDESSIDYIVNNLQSLKFEKMDYNEPTVLEYRLVFCNSSNKIIKTISIPAHEWIGFDGYFHSITRGELDRDYIAGLFD